jgi:hypothetical protein
MPGYIALASGGLRRHVDGMSNRALNEHCQLILGDTDPWRVSEVHLDVEHLVNEVELEVKPSTVRACPQCSARMHIKWWRTRRRRHLDRCRFKAIPEAAAPLVECAEHGAQTVQVPWAEGSSRFTLFFERFAVQVLEACPTARTRSRAKPLGTGSTCSRRDPRHLVPAMFLRHGDPGLALPSSR